MPFESKVPSEKRAELVELIIAGAKTVQEISNENGVPRKTVESWVQRYRREQGIPSPQPGGDRAVAPAALRRKAEKERDGRLAAEAEVTRLTHKLQRMEATFQAVQVTLEYYMRLRRLGEGPAL